MNRNVVSSDRDKMIDKVSTRSHTSYTRDVSRVERNARANATSGSGEVGSNRSTELSLSGEARALQRISKAVQEAPDVRTDVVQQLREKIDAGNYQIDAQKLAERLYSALSG